MIKFSKYFCTSCRRETDTQCGSAVENPACCTTSVRTGLYYPGDKHKFEANTKGISFHSGNTDTKWAVMAAEERGIQMLITQSPLTAIVQTDTEGDE